MSAAPRILLVPVDGSKGAGRAAKLAATLAEGLNVPLRLVFAFPKDPVDMFGIPTEAPRPEELKYFSPEAFGQLRDRSADKAFAAAREAMGETTVAVEQEVVAGDAAEAIIRHAEGVSDPMIVIGSRGLSGFKELLLGSVSQRVLHHAHCPVTVVR